MILIVIIVRSNISKRLGIIGGIRLNLYQILGKEIAQIKLKLPI